MTSPKDLLEKALMAGASAADLLIAEGTEFSVAIRKGEIETLKEAGSKALGVRVFVGKRTASSYTSDFSPPSLDVLVKDTVAMARATGEDAAAGLPDETGACWPLMPRLRAAALRGVRREPARGVQL